MGAPRFFSFAALVAIAMTPAAQQGQAPAGPEKTQSVEEPDARDPKRAPKIAVFRAPGFPTADAPEISDAVLDGALQGLPAEKLETTDAVKDRLRVKEFDLLVLPYGSAFPLAAWPDIKNFLERGGGLVVLGGAPFHQPVRWQPDAAPPPASAGSKPPTNPPGRWVLGPRQPTFARELLLGPAEEIRVAGRECEVRNVAESQWNPQPFPKPTVTYALTVRLATKKDFEKEDGTAGPRDAVLRPLVHLVGKDGVPFACPLLEIDRMRGTDAGARWVLAPSDAKLDSLLINQLVFRAMRGAFEVDARPVLACYGAVDPAATVPQRVPMRVVARRPAPRSNESLAATATLASLASSKSDGESGLGSAPFDGPAEMRVAQVTVPASAAGGLTLLEARTEGGPGIPRRVATGFWVRDAKLLASGPKITVTRDWLRKDGRVFPIVGTTYMASDVHRKFLFEPNPAVWDRDFAEMAKHGVNFVRTGLWTGWQRAMLDPGAIDEGVLRALDAFVLTAASHGIVVCFNFFAFQPPMFGGANPFLDPRALEGQKALLTLIARRYRDCGWVHWDLINEPSYAPADALWQNRPIGDENEKRAWASWVIRRHGTDALVLRDRWRDADKEVLSLPLPAELNYAMIRENRRPRKACDFTHFSNDVVAAWAAELRETLRTAAGSATLVTLGQDEGGTWVRPAQQLYAPSVDYTAVHTWWNNDDLLWDGIVTKVPEKPNVIQETGLMRLEDTDGEPWRSPEDAACLLERKFAYAFASRGAGAIQWAWNVNPYQPIDNEAVIGIFRPDGTAKPELRVLEEFGAFFKEAAPLLDDYEPDPVVVVLPHSRLFAGRPQGIDAVKQVARALAETFGIVPTVISELRLTAERLRGAKLVLVPVPEMLEEGAAAALLEASKGGTKILLTGAVEGDPYGRATESLQALGILDRGRAVLLREPSGSGWVTFDGKKSEWLRRSERAPNLTFDGNVWHEPLPLEFAREQEPLVALLKAALTKAGIDARVSDVPIAARVLLCPKVALVVCVNETASDRVRRVAVDGKSFEVSVLARRSRLALLERATGKVLVATPGAPIVSSR